MTPSVPMLLALDYVASYVRGERGRRRGAAPSRIALRSCLEAGLLDMRDGYAYPSPWWAFQPTQLGAVVLAAFRHGQRRGVRYDRVDADLQPPRARALARRRRQPRTIG